MSVLPLPSNPSNPSLLPPFTFTHSLPLSLFTPPPPPTSTSALSQDAGALRREPRSTVCRVEPLPVHSRQLSLFPPPPPTSTFTSSQTASAPRSTVRHVGPVAVSPSMSTPIRDRRGSRKLWNFG